MADTKTTSIASTTVGSKTLSPEQRRARYTELRAKMGRSKIKVIAPPGVTPFWALKDNQYELARMDWLGFKIVKEKMAPGSVRRFDAAGLKEDGTYVLGDVVLMEINSEIFEMQKQIELEDFQQLQNNIAEEFKSKGAKNEVPVFEVDEKGNKSFAPVT